MEGVAGAIAASAAEASALVGQPVRFCWLSRASAIG